jgi:hypothetical protein
MLLEELKWIIPSVRCTFLFGLALINDAKSY